MTLRSCISYCLCAGAILLGVLTVAGVLYGILHSVGDTPVAAAAGGIALVTLLCLAIDFVTLVVMMAFAAMQCLDRLTETEEEE